MHTKQVSHMLIRSNHANQPINQPQKGNRPFMPPTRRSNEKPQSPSAVHLDYEAFSPAVSQTGSPPDESFRRFMETQDRQSHSLHKLVQQQQQSTLALTLPQHADLSGDPVDNCDFIRAFKHLVEQKTLRASAHLYNLVQHTSGPVQELMKSCLSMQEAKGYTEARRLLKEKYGQNYRVAAAHVKQQTEGSSIKSKDWAALQQFSIQLTNCVNTLKEIGYINKLDNPDNLRKVIDRFPYGIGLKWRDTMDHIIERKERHVTVNDIYQFLNSGKTTTINHQNLNAPCVTPTTG